MVDPVSKHLIEIPARCIRCPSRDKVIELRSFICLINDFYNKDDNENEFKCPLC